TRAAVLDTARALFLADGYAATTVPAIAAAAGVSVETIYKSFGPKPGLVRALWAQGLGGTVAVPVEQRSDAVSATDAVELITGWGELLADVAPRAVPILLLIRSAASTDVEMAALLEETERQRRE